MVGVIIGQSQENKMKSNDLSKKELEELKRYIKKLMKYNPKK